jgi:nudix-type nucleoside diphosphatase (YffH/AdpP family)
MSPKNMTIDTRAEKPQHRILDTLTAYTGWTKIRIATIRLADGHTVKREIEDHGEAACVLPYNSARRCVVLVRQLRAPVLFAARTQEVIAGIIEDEDAINCVRREAKEEAHLDLDSVEQVLTAWTMPGLSTERMHFFLACYVGEARPEFRGGIAGDHENTTAVEIGLADLARMADGNELADVKTGAAATVVAPTRAASVREN